MKVDEELKQFNLSLYRSLSLVHAIGYGLLLFWSIDVSFSFIEQDWQGSGALANVLTQLTDSAPVPLLGMGLAFLGERRPRYGWEHGLLKMVSWLSGLFMVLYVGLLMAGIYSTTQLWRQADNSFQQQIQQRDEQLESLRSQVEQASSSTELAQLSKSLKVAPQRFDDSAPSLDALKADLLDRVTFEQARHSTTLRQDARSKKQRTLRTLVRNGLAVLLASFLYGQVWKNTAWARRT